MAEARSVIRLNLTRAIDMFEAARPDLDRGFGGADPGVERCVAELTGGAVRSPVHLEIVLPAAEIIPGIEARLMSTLQHYCDAHRRRNNLARRTIQWSGVRALRIGAPVSLLGLAIVGVASAIGAHDPLHDVVDIVGWVFAWLGLWYPFDKVLFYPLDLVRDNHALTALHDATLTVSAAVHR